MSIPFPKDYFSRQAAEYSRFRPSYPPELFAYLDSLVPDHQLAWDCATGNGQAALGLAPYFDKVIATDLSERQIQEATPCEKVEYRVAPAEKSGFADHSVSLVTVATAVHWFDYDAFYAEVRRVCVPGGVLAVWAYRFPVITPAVDEAVRRFYYDKVGKYWPPGREKVDDDYRTLPFPFEEVPARMFESGVQWELSHLIGYIQTWSALNLMIQREGVNPLEAYTTELAHVWGDPKTVRAVTFPIFLRAGRVNEKEGS